MTASHETIWEEKVTESFQINVAATFTALASGPSVEIAAADCWANSPVVRTPFLLDPLSGSSVPCLSHNHFSTLSTSPIRRATHDDMGLEDDGSSSGRAG